MKIKISMADYAFLHLKNTSSLNDEGEEWKRGTDEDAERLRKTHSVGYSPIELPSPLEYANLFFTRNDDFYSVGLILKARFNSAFKNISPTFIKEFENYGLIFYPTIADGAGHIVDKENKVRGSVLRYSPSERIVGLGYHGSFPRRLDDLEGFLNGVQECEFLSTTIINTVLKRKGISKKYGKYKLPEGLTLYLNL